jgi:hypothetical protein
MPLKVKNLPKDLSRVKKPETLLRKLIHQFDFGCKREGIPKHSNPAARIAAFIEGDRQCFPRQMRNEHFYAHFSANETYYFTADGRLPHRASKDGHDYTLLMIDIDCHNGTGSLSGAIEFAEYLRLHWLPNLYYEVSTSGTGVHGYLFLNKEGCGGQWINTVARHFQSWLRGLLAEFKFNVSGIEIKGTSPEVTRIVGGKISFKCGQLAKLPREMLTRFDEFKRTPVVSGREIMRLPVPEKVHAAESSLGPMFSGQDLDRLRSVHHVAAKKLLNSPSQPLPTGRVQVVREDVAVFFFLLEWFTANPNSDGSMPMARFEVCWKYLVKEGHVKRQFDSKRFAAIRNWLDRLSLLEWEDANFYPGFISATGRFVRGQACKWKASEEMMNWLTELEFGQKADRPLETTKRERDTSQEQYFCQKLKRGTVPTQTTISRYRYRWWITDGDLNRLICAA